MDIDSPISSELEKAIKEAQTVIFLCSGNIIRSAFADIYSRHMCIERVRVLSAGTTYRNSSLHENTYAALSVRGVAKALLDNFAPTYLPDMDLVSEEPNLGATPYLIFGMTDDHVSFVRKNIPSLSYQTFLLKELIGQKTNIGDPYFEGNWDEAFNDISTCVTVLCKMLATDDIELEQD